MDFIACEEYIDDSINLINSFNLTKFSGIELFIYKLYSQSIFMMKKTSNLHKQAMIKGENTFQNKDNVILEEECNESQDQLLTIVQQIQKNVFFNNRSRHTKIKLDSWMEILKSNQFNSVWKANKLNYLKLLQLMCQCERLVHPFTSFPKHDTLPLLQKHQINRIIDQIEKEVRGSKLTTKRHHHPNTEVTQVKKRKSSHPLVDKSTQCYKSKGKEYEGKENIYDKKNQNGQKHQKSKLNHGLIDTLEHQTNNLSLQLSKNGIKDEATTIKLRQLKKKLTNSSNVNHKTQTMPIIKLNNQKISDFVLNEQEKNRYRPQSPKHKHHNSISDSVNLQLSPVSISSKVWQITHKKPVKRRLNQTFDLTKLMRTPIQASKHQRHSNPPQIFISIDEQYSTGEALKLPHKQYWESNTYTGNATPKYLNSFKHVANISFSESQDYEAFRSEDKACCQCSYQFWSNLP